MTGKVRLCPGGPVVVRGIAQVLDARGERHTSARPAVALCACGRAATAPWCDSTHKSLTAERSAAQESLDFGGLTICFDEQVLRPRPWTLEQSLWAQDLLPDLPEGRVLELCSGAGQIGLRAVMSSPRHLVCVDLSASALAWCAINASAAGLADRVELRGGRMTDAVASHETFPLIVADPPWVPSSGTSRFPEDPLLAIDGGPDGLAVVRECLDVIAACLAPGGAALLQLGNRAQADAVAGRLAGSHVEPGELREYDGGTVLRLERR